MPRETRLSFTREGFSRDVHTLFVIAAEGSETEMQYFEELKASNLYNRLQIYIEPLKRRGTLSSPTSVLAAIKEFKKDFNIRKGDELWALIDRDKQSWEIAEIDSVAQQCHQGKIGFAMSNPSFEIWLLLHLLDIEGVEPDEKALILANARISPKSKRKYIDKLLSNLLEDGYKKNDIKAKRFIPSITVAISRAEKLDKNPQQRWPNDIGTHVYRLISKILATKVEVRP